MPGDLFTQARVVAVSLYLGLGIFVLYITSIINGVLTRELLDPALATSIPNIHAEILAGLDHNRFVLRLVTLISFAIGSYFIADIALRPIRKMMELQKRFIANVSHELRTPLTLAKVDTEIALRARESLTREDAIALLERNSEEIDHIARIIQYFLVTTDLNGHRNMMALQPVQLKDSVETVLARSRVSAEAKSILLVANITDDAVVMGNGVAFEKLLTNLVRNAITYTEEGSVVVGLAQYKKNIQLTVTDTGPGIVLRDVPHIFEPFYRGQHSKKGGSGLGLAIVREVAKMHGGQVSVSKNEPHGSIFTVTFPVI